MRGRPVRRACRQRGAQRPHGARAVLLLQRITTDGRLRLRVERIEPGDSLIRCGGPCLVAQRRDQTSQPARRLDV